MMLTRPLMISAGGAPELPPPPPVFQVAVARRNPETEIGLLEFSRNGHGTSIGIPIPASAYALDFSPSGDRLAYGTREGEIGSLSLTNLAPDATVAPLWRFDADSGIIAIRGLARGEIVAATSNGQLLFLDRKGRESAPRLSFPGGGPIVGLGGPANGQLAVVSASGGLGLIDLHTKSIACMERGFAPMAATRFVSLLPLDDGRSFVYPWEDGHLGTWVPGMSLTRRKVHGTGIPCIFPFESGFASIGHDDGVFHCWPSSLDKPLVTCAAPRSVFRGVSLPGAPREFLLLDTGGGAGHYRLGENGLEQERLLEGHRYRAAAAPHPETYARDWKRAKKARARHAATVAYEHFAAGAPDRGEDALLELERVGAPADADMIRLHRAMEAGDLPGALGHARVLNRASLLLPPDGVTLLHMAEQALSVLRPEYCLMLLSYLPQPYKRSLRYQDLRHRAKAQSRAMKNGAWVADIGKDCSFELLLEIACALEEPLLGRYVLCSQELSQCPDFDLPLAELGAMLAASPDGNGTETGAPTEHYWLHAALCDPVEFPGAALPGAGLPPALRILAWDRGGRGNSLITVALVMDCGREPLSDDYLRHNGQLLEWYQQARDGRSADVWFKRVMRDLDNSMEKLVNEHRSQHSNRFK